MIESFRRLIRLSELPTAALKLVCGFYAATFAWRSFASAFWCASTPSARRRF